MKMMEFLKGDLKNMTTLDSITNAERLELTIRRKISELSSPNTLIQPIEIDVISIAQQMDDITSNDIIEAIERFDIFLQVR